MEICSLILPPLDALLLSCAPLPLIPPKLSSTCHNSNGFYGSWLILIWHMHRVYIILKYQTYTWYILNSCWGLWYILWLTQLIARLVTLGELHLDRQPPTVVMQATAWWETVLTHVKKYGLGLNLHAEPQIWFELPWESIPQVTSHASAFHEAFSIPSLCCAQDSIECISMCT